MSVFWVPKCTPLFIDKLSMTMHVSDKDKNMVRNDFLEIADSFYGGKVWQSVNYRYNKKIYSEENSLQYALIQCDPKQSGANFLRIEYNPSKINPAEIATSFGHIIPGGYKELMKYGRITRIDIATDAKRLITGNLLFQYPGLSVSKNYLKSGLIQTAYLGGDNSENQFVFYDKVAEINHKNSQKGMLYKEIVPPHPVIRIEWRYRPKKICTFEKLLNKNETGNAFKKLSLSVQKGKFKVPENDFEAMVRLVLGLSKYQGLQQALFLVPKPRRKQVRDAIMKSGYDEWWEPDDLWETLTAAIKPIVNPAISKYLPPIWGNESHSLVTI